MYKLIFFIVSIYFISYSQILSQDNFCSKTLAYEFLNTKGEVYFSFEMFDKSSINSLSEKISIDNVSGNKVFAYANKEEFEKFLKINILYWVL